jgi:hypothetical protein
MQLPLSTSIMMNQLDASGNPMPTRTQYVSQEPIDIFGIVKPAPKKEQAKAPDIKISSQADISRVNERKLPSQMASQVKTLEDTQLPANLNRSPTTSAIERIPESLAPTIPGADESLAQMAQRQKEIDRAQLGLAGAKFFLDTMNANNAYESFKTATRMNVENARFEAEESRRLGRERAMAALSEGRKAGEDVTLSMAAQGQDVTGAATQTAQESIDIIAAYNAMNEETNAIREALGYKLQEVQFGFDLDQRRIERNTTILGSALTFGATAYAYRNVI